MNDKDGIKAPAFRYCAELTDKDGVVVDAWEQTNLIPQLGLDLLIQAPFGDAAPVSTFYLGVFTKNYLPTAATKASDIPANMGEFVGYDEETRPLWDKSYDGAGSYDNSSSRAQFTFKQDQVLYGAFLVSEPTKGGNNGLLLSVVRFPSPRSVSAGLTLNVSCGLTYIPNNM